MSRLQRWVRWGLGILLLLSSQGVPAGENPRGAPVRHLSRTGVDPSRTPPRLLLPQVQHASPEVFRDFPCTLGEPGEHVGLLSRRDDVRRRLEMMRTRDWEGLLRELSAPPAPVEPDTVRVLVIRVDFLEDSGGDRSSTPDGRFDLRSNDEAQTPIDPPPHNKAYFESHMEALQRYYWHQSGGSLYIDYDVFPAESDSAYHLSDTGDYGPWIISVDNPDLLALATKFVTDAVTLADSMDPAIDYGAYDAHLIFHAGPDFQGDINRDTPFDIPSFNLFLSDPIAVEDSTVFLDLLMVVPETVSQDDFLGGLNGVIAHEFGHQLDFYDLYDVFTFLPVVGMFSLMDSGDNTFGTVFDPFREEFVFVRGALPASLDPWHKYLFFGPNAVWNGVSFRELTQPGEETVEASILSREVLLLPLNLQEWYLIENRPFDLNGDGTVILRADSLTGVILGPDHDDGAPEDTLATMEYDYLLPGEGLLIWHIDWEAIGDAWSRYGAINVLRDRRGVHVVEADGIPDLGDPFSPEWTGGPFDYWFVGGFTKLGPDTDPPSDSNHGTPSFITLDVLDPPGNAMRLRWGQGWVRTDWPSAGSGPIGTGGALAVSLRGEEKTILAASGPGIVAWSGSGSRFVDLMGRSFWALAEGELAGALSWNRDYAWEPGGSGAVAAISRQGQLHVWDCCGFSEQAKSPSLVWPDSLTAVQEPRIVATSPVVLDSIVLVGGDDGRIRALRPTLVSEGLSPLRWRLAPNGGAINALGAGDLNEDGIVEVFWATENGQVGWASGPQEGPVRLSSGWTQTLDSQFPATDVLGAVSRPEYGPKGDPGGLWSVDAAGRLRRWPVAEGGVSEEVSLLIDLGEPPAGPMALGDLDGDGLLEIVVPAASGRVHVFAMDGSREGGWPADLWNPDREPPGPVTAPPLVLPPMEGRDGLLFQRRPRGEVAVLNHEGQIVRGWPQTLGFDVSSLWLGDLEGDGDLEVVTGDVEGYVTVLDVPLDWADARGTWSLAGGSPARTRFLSGEMVPEPNEVSGPLVDGSVRIYPNPVRGKEALLDIPLTAPARVRMEAIDSEGRRVAQWEWSALGGSRGERLPVDVTGLSPGFYLCRVVVEGSGSSFSTLEKIAVVR